MNRDMYAVGRGKQKSPFPFCMKIWPSLIFQLFPWKPIKMVWVNFVTRQHCEIDPWLVMYLDRETYECLARSHNFDSR